jgi:hypothetical protein
VLVAVAGEPPQSRGTCPPGRGMQLGALGGANSCIAGGAEVSWLDGLQKPHMSAPSPSGPQSPQSCPTLVTFVSHPRTPSPCWRQSLPMAPCLHMAEQLLSRTTHPPSFNPTSLLLRVVLTVNSWPCVSPCPCPHHRSSRILCPLSNCSRTGHSFPQPVYSSARFGLSFGRLSSWPHSVSRHPCWRRCWLTTPLALLSATPSPWAMM